MIKVAEFEKTIAEFYGAPYAVATDCCTHALELSLRFTKVTSTTCPARTYISVPFTLTKLNIDWKFVNTEWKDYYFLSNTRVVDAAVYWKQDGYIPGTLMCLSFQFKKHLNLIRGGAILVDSLNTYTTLKKMSYDGRLPDTPWAEQNISSIGYHYYMAPETAALGLEKFSTVKNLPPKQWSYCDYPDLRNMDVFKNV